MVIKSMYRTTNKEIQPFILKFPITSFEREFKGFSTTFQGLFGINNLQIESYFIPSQIFAELPTLQRYIKYGAA